MRAYFLSFGVIGLLFAGCGDDSATPTDSGPADTGPRDAGTPADAGPDDAGRRDTGTLFDGGPEGTLPECDIFAPDCAADEKCAVVVDRNDSENVFLYFGCVPISTGTKPAGVVCATLGQDATPDDASDEVVTDECAEGNFCWTTGTSPIAHCEPLCGSDDPEECAADQYCQTINSEPFFGLCSAADNCDPIHQTGCSDGDACYWVRNTMETFLGNCFEFAAPDGGTGMPGEPCMFINNCQPGTQCLPAVLADGGLGDTASCQELCSRGVVDGGVAPTVMDGGLAGDCPTAETCDEYPFPGTFPGPEVGGYCN